jgi:hypothetical protein
MNDKKVFYSRISIGKAREEGRVPDHDGEYLSLYWCGDEYIIENNAGVIGTHIHNYVDVVNDNYNVTDQDLKLAEEIQMEINEIIEKNQGKVAKNGLSTGPLGLQAREIAQHWGWSVNEDGAYEAEINF